MEIEVRNVSGVPSPLGEDAPKNANTSLGGEKARSVSRKTPKIRLNASASDELINYTDTAGKEMSESTSKDHKGISTPALYDRHPAKKAVI